MTNHTFYIVDVFAQQKYTGNQLAVFRNAADISDGEMQRIARETNFSETTFILSDEPRDGGYDVRIFTPAAEVPFAGHPTLGTAYVISHEIIGETTVDVILNLKAGRIPVSTADDGVLWMKQNPPSFGPIHDPKAIAEVLGLDQKDYRRAIPNPGGLDRLVVRHRPAEDPGCGSSEPAYARTSTSNTSPTAMKTASWSSALRHTTKRTT